jgi:hypothetical protein
LEPVNINPVSSLFPSILPPASTTTNNIGNSNPLSSTAQQADASGISPAASFMNELQQLQQQNPDQFNQLVTQISSRLQQEAQQASASGDTTKATQLNKLADQFQSAANGGQIPTLQQLQQSGLTGHHHHGGHHRSGQASATNAFQAQSSDTDSQNLLAALTGSTSSTQAS